jgi:hypothetical protein
MDGMGIEEKTREIQLDEMADLHARLSACESKDILLSRRITALEESARGNFNDDPMKQMGPMIWIMVLLTFGPLIFDLVSKWRSSQSQS